MSTQRRYDRQQQKWVDGDSNWFTVTAFRQLAVNAAASLEKGQRIVVTGRLRIRDWESGEKAGTTVEVEAESIGHDLLWGTSHFTRAAAGGRAEQGSEQGAGASDSPEEEPDRAAAVEAPARETVAEPVALPF